MFVQSKATKGGEFRAKFPAFNGCLQRPRFAVNEKSLSEQSCYFFCRKITGSRTQNQQAGAGRPLSRCCDCDKVPNVFVNYYSTLRSFNFYCRNRGMS